MLREIYLKAESGNKQVQHMRKRPSVHNSSSYSRPIRACFLFTGWSKKAKNSSVGLQNATKYSHSNDRNLDSDQSSEHPNVRSPNSNQSQSNENGSSTNKQKVVIEDENRNELVGHVIDTNLATTDIQTEQTDLNNLEGFNTKDSLKGRKSSTRTSFCRTRSAVKKQLSRLLSDKEAGGKDLGNRSLEPHSSGHRTSILVSLRAASILLPLYGLHYLVFVYRLDTT